MKFKQLIKWVSAVFLILAAFGSARLYYRLTDDFRIGNISYPNNPYQPTSHVSLSNEERPEIQKILNQPFYYLGKGAQSYAFADENEEYVLKFFKFKHLKPHWTIELLPSISPFNHLKEHNRINKLRKLSGVFKGYEIACEHYKEGAQLVYLHLIPTDFLEQQLTVYDKIGRKHEMDSDHTIFLIQKKGQPLREKLDPLFEDNQIDEVKKSLTLIFNMYMHEYRMGIYDRDHGVLQNTGFIGDRPFHLDVGKLSRDDKITRPEFYKKDLEIVMWRMDRSFKSKYPEYYPEINTFLKDEYRRLTDEELDVSLITLEEIKARRHRL